MKKIALITGATSGIGEATARLLSKNGYDLILTGRRNDRLAKIKCELEVQSNSNVLILNFDIRSEQEVSEAIKSIPDSWKNISVLINNAGLAAGMEPIQEGSIDDWNKMIDTNIKGLLYITKEVSNLMISHRAGHIINISSIAGREVYPNGNVYCATKHAVSALTRAMRIDLYPYGIKVGSISPGMVETEFSEVRFHGDKQRAQQVYKGLEPLTGTDIAEAILFILNRPEHVNIDDVFITPKAQGSSRDALRDL